MSEQTPTPHQAQPAQKSPYVGPYPIQTGQPFFGRKTETAELVSRLIARRIVLLHAPSGAGKTSLIQAGLLPALGEQKYLALPILHMTRVPLPEDLPAGKQYNRFCISCLLSLYSKIKQPPLPLARLVEMPLAEALAEIREWYAKQEEQQSFKRTLLIFDQFEEILTIQPTDRASKEQFFNELMPVLDDNRYWVLFAMREDFLARLDPYLGYFPDRLSAHFQLDFLGLEAARQAIIGPLEGFDTQYTPEAVDKLVHDLSLVRGLNENNEVVELPGVYIEPVELQVVCDRLWRAARPDATQITLEDVEKYGRVVDALAGYYADAVARAAEAASVPVRNIRQFCEQALIAEGGLRQPVPQGREIEFGITPECVGVLVDAYLVRVEEQRGSLWYRLAHDRLVDAVRSDNAHWNVENLNLLQRQAILWDGEGRPDRLLLQDASLEEAERWLAGSHEPLTLSEQDLFDRSRDLQTEKEEARQKELRTNRRIRRYLVVAVSVAVVAVVAFIVAIWAVGEAKTQTFAAQTAKHDSDSQKMTAEYNAQVAGTNAQAAENARGTAEFNRKEAERNAKEALDQKNNAAAAEAKAKAGEEKAQAALKEQERLATQAAAETVKANSQRLAFQAQQLLNSDPDLAALLSIEAYQASHTTEAIYVLLNSIYEASVSLEDVGVAISGFTSDIFSLAISPDERYLAVGCKYGEVFLVDLQNEPWSPEKLPVPHTDAVKGLEFSPDGSALASSGIDGWLFLYRLDNQQLEKYKLQRPSDGLSFRPDGKKLAVAEGRVIQVYDSTPGSLKLSQDLQIQRNSTSGYIHEVVYSPDGARLAVSEQGEEGNDKPHWVSIFNAENGSLLFLKGEHTRFITDLAWSADGRYLVSSGMDGMLVVWDTLLKTFTSKPTAHQKKTISSVATSYDGKYLISGGWDNYVRVWSIPDLDDLGQEQYLALPRNVLAVTFSPRSYLFASGGVDKLVTMRKLVTQLPMADPAAPIVNGPVRAMVADPQGQLFWLYPDLRDNWYYLHSTDPDFQMEKPADITSVYSVALHPNGKLAAFGSDNGLIYTVPMDEPMAEPWPALEGGHAVLSLAFSQDGNQLAASACSQSTGGKCEETSIWIWDVETRTPRLFTKVEKVGNVRALAFDPNNQVLALGAENGAVLAFNLETGDQLPTAIKPSASEVLSLAFSQDGQLLAGGNRAGDMLLWNAAQEYQDIGRLNTGSSGALYALAFDLDGKHLYTGGESGEILYWAISPDLWIDIICSRKPRPLTPEEWRTFFFNDQVRSTCP